MTNDKNDGKTTAADDILRHIEAFGADKSRWPKQADDASLRTPAMARAMREAAALDKLLAMAAPKTPSADSILVDRIVAAAERTPRVVAPNTVSGSAKTTSPAASGDRVVAFQRPASMARFWGADIRRGLAVLAASLVLGLSIGQSGIMDRALLGFEDLTGVPLASVSQDIAGALTDDASGEDY